MPWPCVVLAVDTAERSGWALYLRGELVNWGEVDMLRPERSSDRYGVSGWDAERVCLHALWECARQQELPAVLVFERPFRGAMQGGWTGAWKAAWVRQGGRRAAMIGVFPSAWRARVLNSGSLSRENARAQEMAVARSIVIHSKLGFDKALDHDEAAAICIGAWAIRAGEVGAKLPKRRKP